MVGYNKANVEYSWHMMGVPFTAVDGGEITVGSIKGSFQEGDQIQAAYMDGEYVNFIIYEWYEAGTMDEWEGWYLDGTYVGESFTLPNGAAVWYISNSGEPIAEGLTTSGAVSTSEIIHDGFAESWNMISSGFPIDFYPNGETVNWSGLESGNDQIQVSYMDGEYVIFAIYEWYDAGEMGDDAGWYLDGEYVDYAIAAPGQGFWLILTNPANVYMKEVSPIAK